ncbi:uncharacterized protein Tco025E_10009 [Trypanosoma conorhini]|uniref:Uncharacterized protein n=1 Tax=Trypanosoma conorhini TaxID=83891 RepID=A0A3R7M3I0_9TRYP|nr:uncharacterized protein Tco025E_10009 [Trypanosoma conorhini]RNE95469.1 hypothetical protein Tco025E_10009 [Trypanosoma conorhini]
MAWVHLRRSEATQRSGMDDEADALRSLRVKGPRSAGLRRVLPVAWGGRVARDGCFALAAISSPFRGFWECAGCGACVCLCGCGPLIEHPGGCPFTPRGPPSRSV